MIPIQVSDFGAFVTTIGLYVLLAFLHDRLTSVAMALSPRAGATLTGLLFGGVGVASMFLSSAEAGGVLWDARHVAVALGSLFGGPVAATIAAALVGAYRLWLGGIGAPGGVVSVGLVALIGAAFWAMTVRRSRAVEAHHVLLLAATVAPAVLSSYLFLPDAALARNLLQRTGIPFALAASLGVAVVGVILVVQARGRALRDQLQAIAGNFPGMIMRRVQRPDGSVIIPFVSDGAAELFGVPLAELRRDPAIINRHIHPDDAERLQTAIAEADRHVRPLNLTLRICPPGAPVKWVRNFRRPTRAANGDIVWDGAVIDITAEVAATEQLVQAREEAENASRSKSAFLANMSHELRTPLNAIIGFSEIIHKRIFGSDSMDRYADYAGDIHSAGQHLLGVINGILDIAKIDAGKYELSESEVDLGAVVRDCLLLVRGLAGEAKVAIRNELGAEPLLLRGDERAIRQVILNLLSNAVKFTPAQGAVFVRGTREADGGIVLQVADTGIGIPEEALERVFAPFEQVESGQSRQYEGSGLGLAISRSFMELHGGTLGVESAAGQGTTVSARFPPDRVLAGPSA